MASTKFESKRSVGAPMCSAKNMNFQIIVNFSKQCFNTKYFYIQPFLVFRRNIGFWKGLMPICLSSNSNMCIKMGMKNCSNNNDRGKQKYSAKILPQCQFFQDRSHIN